MNRSMRRSNTPTQSEQRKDSSRGIRIGKDIGRVKVFVRVRAFNQQEKSSNESLPYEINDESTQLRVLADDRGHPEKLYTMDHIFQPSTTNQQVCDKMTPPLVQSAMNGFNGTLMAYGQTGSGKTYTLMSDTGITRSLIERCFSKIQDDTQHNYKVTVSYLQIYQEKIFDLLTNDQNKSDLNIRENPRSGVYVENLTEYVVRSPTEVLEFVAAGKKRLVFAETKMNRTSSRSHAVLQMAIEKSLKETSVQDSNKKEGQDGLQKSKSMSSLDLHSFGNDVIIRGNIYICDLAGSERIKRTGASGERLSEAQSINSSLLELGNVIQALADERATHVPFRNSILTRLLQESLGGNCKTSLVVCVSPSLKDLHETKCTLNFGSRAMKVKNAAYVNMEVDFKSLSDQLLKKLQIKDEEIAALKKQYHDKLESEKEKLRNEIIDDQQENITAIQLEKQVLEDKMAEYDADIEILRSNVSSRDKRIKQLEDSIFTFDDLIRHEKKLCHDLLSTEATIFNLTNSSFNDDIGKIVNMFGKLQPPPLDDEKKLHSWFVDLRQELENIHKVSDQDCLTSIFEQVEQIQEHFVDIIGKETQAKTEKQLSCSRYQVFVTNALNIIKQNLDKLSSPQKISTPEGEKIHGSCLAKINTDLVEKTDEKKTLTSRHNEKVDKENVENESKAVQVDVSIKETNKEKKPFGVQVDEKSFEIQSMKNNKTLVSTTVEDVENVITDIQTENVVENSKIPTNSESLYAFSSSLDRIEGIVKSENFPSRISLSSRFGLSSYFREADLIRRQSSLDYRYDDMYNNNSRLHNNSRVLSSTGESKSNFSYLPVDNSSTNSKSLYYKLSNKFRDLERNCDQLRRENEDYVAMIERLTSLLPNNSEVNQIKERIKLRRLKISVGTQTYDCSEQQSKRSNIQVAHIKPLVSPLNELQPTINISYDMKEDNIVRNIENLQNKSNKNLLAHENHELKTISKRKFSLQGNSIKETDLLGFNSEAEQGIFLSDAVSIKSAEGIQSDTVNDYSCNVFKVLREKKDFQRHRDSPTSLRHRNDRLDESHSPSLIKSPRERPQTWFGFPEEQKNNKFDFSSENFSIGVKSPTHDKGNADITLSKTRRSSWVLPEWMKTKRKESLNNQQQFIQ